MSDDVTDLAAFIEHRYRMTVQAWARKVADLALTETLRRMREDEARQLRLKKGTHLNIIEAAEQAKRRSRRR